MTTAQNNKGSVEYEAPAKKPGAERNWKLHKIYTMKRITSLFLCFAAFTVYAQDNAPFDGHKWEAPYHLPVPKDWTVERFPAPPSFAPAIPYKGVEDIRFTPGWGKTESDEYWSYAFLWFLDGKQDFDSKSLEKDLSTYYTGLFNVNTDKRKIDTSKLVEVNVSIKKKKPVNSDLKTFEGIIKMNDYMTARPITLNVIVHIRTCEGQDKTFVFFELSPKPFSNTLWESLNRLWLDFTCTK